MDRWQRPTENNFGHSINEYLRPGFIPSWSIWVSGPGSSHRHKCIVCKEMIEKDQLSLCLSPHVSWRVNRGFYVHGSVCFKQYYENTILPEIQEYKRKLETLIEDIGNQIGEDE